MKTIFIYILLLMCLSLARAAEIVGESTDTFIFEAMPSKEFSSMPFLGVSSSEGTGALAYLTFKVEPLEFGLLPDKGGKVIDARLELTAYALPNLDSETDDERRRETAKIKMNVYAVIDEECFDPAEGKMPVSWDGEHKFPAPKHDCASLNMDASGLVFLGEIHVDLLDEDFLKSRKIIFAEDSLREFLNFACGVKDPGRKLPIVTGRDFLRHITIILKQISGAEGLLICSADYNSNKEAQKLAAEKRVEKHNKNIAENTAPDKSHNGKDPKENGDILAQESFKDSESALKGGNLQDTSSVDAQGKEISALAKAILREEKLVSLLMEQEEKESVDKNADKNGKDEDKTSAEIPLEDASDTSTEPLPKIIFEFFSTGESVQ